MGAWHLSTAGTTTLLALGWVHSGGWKETFHQETVPAGDPSLPLLSHVSPPGQEDSQGRGAGQRMLSPVLPAPCSPQASLALLRGDQGPRGSCPSALSSTSHTGGLCRHSSPKH